MTSPQIKGINKRSSKIQENGESNEQDDKPLDKENG